MEVTLLNNDDLSAFVYHAWLASAVLPSEVTRNLLQEYGEPSAVYQAFLDSGSRLPGVNGQALQTLRKNASAAELNRYRELISRYGISAFTLSESIYPEALKNIPDPPAILFFRGNPQCMTRKLLSMVGSRSASYIGRETAQKLAKELSDHGVSIVSGMAGGIDTAAHTGCLEGKSPTIAVTGCGLDKIYPSDNKQLHDRILDNDGLILSEYAPGEKPLGWHFPHRNRILTGLAEALILVEAKIRSGSMTSVQHALDQGKDVFVYPGDPRLPHFEGNRQLLREGAIFFTSSEDILGDLHWLDNQPIIRQNSDCSQTGFQASPEEVKVLRALEPGDLGFEQLSQITGFAPASLLSTLTMLQIRGEVEALPGKRYQLKKR